MTAEIDLIVPLKSPHRGKTRLRTHREPSVQHSELVLALAHDTLAAARATPQVRSLLVVTAAPAEIRALQEHDTELFDETDAGGLNSALCRAAQWLQKLRHPRGIVGVLQADLPALRPAELTNALHEAAGERAFITDRQGTGTTLLLAAPGQPLAPRFGIGSAVAHAESGAYELSTPAPTLRSDVDTPQDLAHAARLGLGAHTRKLVGTTALPTPG